jgi:hypothetical protein
MMYHTLKKQNDAHHLRQKLLFMLDDEASQEEPEASVPGE